MYFKRTGMKRGLIIIFAFLAAACHNPNGEAQAPYKMEDLKKVQWLEGNWVGLDGAQPFYEIYKIINDSTLEITSYNWTGTDSTGSSKSYLVWKNGYYYLGESLNWKVTEITNNAIEMVPVRRASNDILWKNNGGNSWLAILKTKSGEKRYHMKPAGHFQK
jgi:hypothetical protein